MARSWDYDVYISYSHKDRDWVRNELLPRLEGNGLRVCIDYQAFRRGQPALSEIERAVQTSRRTLAVLTPGFLESQWTGLTTQMVQALDPSGQGGRLVLLLLESCALPLHLSTLGYLNFTDADHLDSAWEELLVTLGAPSVNL